MDLFLDTAGTLASWSMELRFNPATVKIRRIESVAGDFKVDPNQFETGRVQLASRKAGSVGFGSGKVRVARVFFHSTNRQAAPFRLVSLNGLSTGGHHIPVQGRAQAVKIP